MSSKMTQEGLHVAFIMDGNGRWANFRNKARYFGHRAGAEALRHIVEVAPHHKIHTLTAYAFSSDNWGRPQKEVSTLMKLFSSYLRSETRRLRENDVKLSFIGRRDRFSKSIVRSMEAAEQETYNGKLLHFRLATDYSAREAILHTAEKLKADPKINRDNFHYLLTQSNGTVVPDVDLLVRTGGEQRLSDFLLWECAYAELFFTDVMWPDFREEHLQEALNSYYSRERRFGRIPQNANTG
ncbi:MAG: di-trans,poly-cis-decaprenylcistransferase [Caldithrix sp.]|nr:di-trans,poly-cis-decaprenylcistransferase [Caldithrix sp.]